MTKIFDFPVRIDLPDNVSSHIRTIHYIYSKNVVIIVFKNGRRFAWENMSLFDFLDYVAKAEQQKSFGVAIFKFLKKIGKSRELSDNEFLGCM